ncbi:hypothetical protein [Fodinibius salsisoli]|uniref:DUF4402 domain-containing protein n=1 Tax=Fodinibius salsisoli TaxID=2820877 RepID=A0ABT3PKL5_9BACT|nr:hypothetical protein [Fodinibius salsisoli]MCW9706298.1 hypothetical protein [Fodinibius salsisoli]
MLFGQELLYAQRINFGLYGDGLMLTPLNSGTLDFNEAQPLIISGTNESITINLADDTQLMAIIEIAGEKQHDVMVDIDSPGNVQLAGDASQTIPFELRWAYSNTSPVDIEQAKAEAREMTLGFNAATFPILRRELGPPGPPPVPPHGNYEAPMGTAYLFIYGTLGPVGNVPVGSYSATVNIYAEYTTYD